MEVDLQKAQEAVNLAHANFRLALSIDQSVYKNTIIDYTNEFLNSDVRRPRKVLDSARKCQLYMLNFENNFLNLIFDINALTIERDILVNGVCIASMSLIMKDVSGFLDNVRDQLILNRKYFVNQNSEVIQNSIEKLKIDSQNLGYAVALIEQLSADMLIERHRLLGQFCNMYLHQNTVYESFASVDGKDVILILKEVVFAVVPQLMLVGVFKAILDIWEKKRARLAGVRSGDTDYLLELDDILEMDVEFSKKLIEYVAEAKKYAETLRSEQAKYGM